MIQLSNITIRPVHPQDIPSAINLVLSVAGRLFQPDAVADFITDHRHELMDIEDFQRGYSFPDGLFLVVLDADTLIGTGAIRRLDGETAELRRMWLLEAYQGNGIGYRLARELLAFARTTGYRRIRLTTNEENVRAVRFYDRLGFYRIEPYHRTNDDVYMEYLLDGKIHD